MKMDAANELSSNGRMGQQQSKPQRVHEQQSAITMPPPSPKDIGREFVRQYYTMLSERPQDVFRFYSHESFFMHGSDDPIQGQQNIQKAIESLQFVDCKARIYTVCGTSTLNNGLVIQVCGELSIRKSSGRRFLQTFILCPQTPKKYYVHNDVFQWLDQAFGDQSSDAHSVAESESASITGSNYEVNSEFDNNNTSMPVLLTNGQMMHHLVDNGHVALQQQQPTTSDPSGEHVPLVSDAGVGVTSETSDDQHTGTISDGVNATAVSTTEVSAPLSVRVDDVTPPQQQPQLPTGPKTWANIIGGSSYTTTVKQVPAAPPPSAPDATVVPTMNNNNSSDKTYRDNNNGENYSCRLYLGSIERNKLPADTETPEREIRRIFEQYGPVDQVNMPRKTVDAQEPNKFAFAFIVMKTPDGAKNAYAACRHTNNLKYLKIKVDSFGFDGEATLSEQKAPSGPGGGGPSRNNYRFDNMVPKGGSPRSFPPAAGGAYQGGGGGRGGGRGGGGMMNNRGASNMVGDGNRGGRGGGAQMSRMRQSPS